MLPRANPEPVITESSAMRAAFNAIASACSTQVSILVRGSMGSGRRTLIREAHQTCRDTAGTLAEFDCLQDPSGHLDSLLASGRLAGRARALLLADLDALPVPRVARTLQLLRGTAAPSRLYVSLSSDLPNDHACRDLFPRAPEACIDVPDLKARKADIVRLAHLFLRTACRRLAIAEKTLDAPAQALLTALPWHGQVTELRGLVESLAAGQTTSTISVDHVLRAMTIDAFLRTSATRPTLREASREFERRYITLTLDRHRGQVAAAARALGIQRPNLYRKMRTLGLFQRFSGPQ